MDSHFVSQSVSQQQKNRNNVSALFWSIIQLVSWEDSFLYSLDRSCLQHPVALLSYGSRIVRMVYSNCFLPSKVRFFRNDSSSSRFITATRLQFRQETVHVVQVAGENGALVAQLVHQRLVLFHVAPRTSPDRAAVRIANSKARAPMPSCARSATMNAPASDTGTAAMWPAFMIFLGDGNK